MQLSGAQAMARWVSFCFSPKRWACEGKMDLRTKTGVATTTPCKDFSRERGLRTVKSGRPFRGRVTFGA